MSEHFNQLRPAEMERLALLAEEMAEAAQVIGKILRHGYDSHNPLDPTSPTNRHMLEVEIGHVRHALSRMFGSGDVSESACIVAGRAKAASVCRWLHHQPDQEKAQGGDAE